MAASLYCCKPPSLILREQRGCLLWTGFSVLYLCKVLSSVIPLEINCVASKRHCITMPFVSLKPAILPFLCSGKTSYIQCPSHNFIVSHPPPTVTSPLQSVLVFLCTEVILYFSSFQYRLYWCSDIPSH